MPRMLSHRIASTTTNARRIAANRLPRAAAISDDEMEDDYDDVDVPDEVPARKATKPAASSAKKAGKAKAVDPEEDDEEGAGDDDDEEGEDEYQVEKILTHEFSEQGDVLYRIMWLGYPNEEDLTWEPVENLSGAKEVLTAYHKSIGGAPTPRKKSAAAGRAAGGGGRGGGKGAKNNKRVAPGAEEEEAEDSLAPPAKKRGRKSNAASAEASANGAAPKSSSQLPLGLWEDDVQRVTAIIEDTEQGQPVAKTRKITSLKGLLEWNNGRKTEHTMDVLRQKCPQRLLDYYEQHLLRPTVDEYEEWFPEDFKRIQREGL